MTPWEIVRLDYVRENLPRRYPLNVPFSALVERKKAALLAKLNEILGEDASDLSEFKERVEYHYLPSNAMVPSMKFTKEQFSRRIAVYAYKYGKITRKQFSERFPSHASAENGQAAAQQVRPSRNSAPRERDLLSALGMAAALMNPSERSKSSAVAETSAQLRGMMKGIFGSLYSGVVDLPVQKRARRRVRVTFSIHPLLVDQVAQAIDDLNVLQDKLGTQADASQEKLPLQDPAFRFSSTRGLDRFRPRSSVGNLDDSSTDTVQELLDDPYVPSFSSSGSSNEME